MNACVRCSLAERLSVGGEVIIYSAQSYLTNRILDALPGAKGHYHTAITLKINAFNSFIRELSQMVSLTPTESDHLLIAHMTPGESYGPDLLGKVRPLSQWNRLIDEGPLLDVLKHKKLMTYFQPIVDLEKRDVFGYECLSRGIGHDGEVLSPLKLINDARETDMLFNLDRMMRETCLHSASEASIDKHIFINFMPTAVYNPEYCLKTTVAWVKKLNLDPGRIVFEVVETEKIQDNNHLIKILNFYRSTGFKVALDDVAAGYSGLLQLMTIRPDIMKMDRKVVDGIHKDADKQSIFRALMNVAKDYGIRTLAEGVEHQADLDFVRQYEVSLVQGYLFGKPQAEPTTIDVTAMLETESVA